MNDVSYSAERVYVKRTNRFHFLPNLFCIHLRSSHTRTRQVGACINKTIINCPSNKGVLMYPSLQVTARKYDKTN